MNSTAQSTGRCFRSSPNFNVAEIRVTRLSSVNCAKCDTSTLPIEKRYECKNRCCRWHGSVFCEACVPTRATADPPQFTLDGFPGALGAVICVGASAAGMLMLFTSIWIAAVIGAVIAVTGCLIVKVAGGNLMWDLKIIANQTTTTFRCCPNCRTPARPIPRRH